MRQVLLKMVVNINGQLWMNDTLSKYFDVLKVTTDFDIEGIAPGEKYFYVCRKKVQE